MFIQNICLGHFQHCLYRFSVCLHNYLQVDQIFVLTYLFTSEPKCTLVRAFNIQKCKLASSIRNMLYRGEQHVGNKKKMKNSLIRGKKAEIFCLIKKTMKDKTHANIHKNNICVKEDANLHFCILKARISVHLVRK